MNPKQLSRSPLVKKSYHVWRSLIVSRKDCDQRIQKVRVWWEFFGQWRFWKSHCLFPILQELWAINKVWISVEFCCKRRALLSIRWRTGLLHQVQCVSVPQRFFRVETWSPIWTSRWLGLRAKKNPTQIKTWQRYEVSLTKQIGKSKFPQNYQTFIRLMVENYDVINSILEFENFKPPTKTYMVFEVVHDIPFELAKLGSTVIL